LNTRNHEAYGQKRLTFVDRLGVWLSQRAISRELPSRSDLEVLELGCGYRATQLVALSPRLKRGVGVDFKLAPELAGLENFSFHEGAIEEALVKLSGQTFDAVLLISVLEHLRDPLPVFCLSPTFLVWSFLKSFELRGIRRQFASMLRQC